MDTQPDITGVISPNTPVAPQAITDIPGVAVLPPDAQQKLDAAIAQMQKDGQPPEHILALSTDFNKRYRVKTPIPEAGYLTPDKRQQLSGILDQMQTDGQSPEHQHAIAQEFIQQNAETPWTQSVKSRLGDYMQASPYGPQVPPKDLQIQESPVVALLKQGAREIIAAHRMPGGKTPEVSPYGLIPFSGLAPQASDLASKGLADLANAGMQAGAMPGMAIGAVAAPAVTGIGLLSGYATKVPPGARELLGTGAGLIGGVAGAEGAANYQTLRPLATEAAGTAMTALRGAGKGLWDAHFGTEGQVQKPRLGSAIALGALGNFVGGHPGAVAGGVLPEVVYSGKRMVQGAREALAERARVSAPPPPGEVFGEFSKNLDSIVQNQYGNKKVKFADFPPETQNWVWDVAASDWAQQHPNVPPPPKPNFTPSANVPAKTPVASPQGPAPAPAPAQAPPAPVPAPPALVREPTPLAPVKETAPEAITRRRRGGRKETAAPEPQADVAAGIDAKVKQFNKEPASLKVYRQNKPIKAGLKAAYIPNVTPEHIPLPADLGFPKTVGIEDKLVHSDIGHHMSQNEKAYSAALHAWDLGVRDPAFFDALTEPEKAVFMNGDPPAKSAVNEGGNHTKGALHHARETDNPTPITHYQKDNDSPSILGEGTTDLIKAHLEQMLEDGGPKDFGKGHPPLIVNGERQSMYQRIEASKKPSAVIKRMLREETGSVGRGSGAPEEVRQLGRDVINRMRGVAKSEEGAGFQRAVEGRRGERATTTETALTDDEQALIQRAVNRYPQDKRAAMAADAERVIRDKKSQFPQTGENAFSPVTAAKIEFTRTAKGTLKPEIEYSKTPYGFDAEVDGQRLWTGTETGAKAQTAQLTPKGNEVADKMAGEIVKEVNDLKDRAAKARDIEESKRSVQEQTDVEVAKQTRWYRAARSLVRRIYGSAGTMWADLAGATSPKTPVAMNYRYSIDALEQALKGNYDPILNEYREYVRQGGERGTYEGNVPRSASGNKFGANSKLLLKALDSAFRGQVGVGPKTPNFTENLLGISHGATIDVWAARALQRIRNRLYGDAPIVPTAAEGAVKGKTTPTGPSGQFKFGQEVFERAAKQLNMSPDDLQALIWFTEKDRWTQAGITSGEGEGGDLAAHLAESGMQRVVAAGAPSEKGMSAAVRMARNDPNIAAVVNTHAVDLQGKAHSNFEFTVKPGGEDTINRLAAEAIKAAKKAGSDHIIIARSLSDPKTNENYVRPGVSVYFKNPLTEKEVKALNIDTSKIGHTALFGAPNVAKGRYAGIRSIFTPETGAGTKAEALDAITEIIDRIEDDGRVAHAMLEHYDALRIPKDQYDESIRAFTLGSKPEAKNVGGSQAAATNTAGQSGPWQRPIGAKAGGRSGGESGAKANPRNNPEPARITIQRKR
jgi:hypothetical protein